MLSTLRNELWPTEDRNDLKSLDKECRRLKWAVSILKQRVKNRVWLVEERLLGIRIDTYHLSIDKNSVRGTYVPINKKMPLT